MYTFSGEIDGASNYYCHILLNKRAYSGVTVFFKLYEVFVKSCLLYLSIKDKNKNITKFKKLIKLKGKCQVTYERKREIVNENLKRDKTKIKIKKPTIIPINLHSHKPGHQIRE